MIEVVERPPVWVPQRPSICSIGGAGAAAMQGARRHRARWTPAQWANLTHWHRGTDVVEISGEIERYADKEGSVDAIAPTVAARPGYSASIALLNNKPGGVYTRADSHWVRAEPFAAALAQPFTIVVAWTTASTGTVAAIAGSSAGAAGGSRTFIRQNGTDLQMHAGTSTASASITLATGTAYTGIVVFNGTSSIMRVNGSEVYAGALDVGSNSVGELILGRESSADYHDGDIAEAMVASGDITADAPTLAELESYLSARYL